MKYKTLVRLALKLVGVLLLAYAIPDLVNTGTMFVLAIGEGYTPWFGSGSLELSELVMYMTQIGAVGTLLKLIIGGYLLFGGAAVANLCVPSNRTYCPECGYELRMIAGERCPECGSHLSADLLASAEPPSPALSEGEPASPPPRHTGVLRFVPIHNRRALIGYYLAVASLIPVLGLVLGPAAFAYGLEGLRDVREHPEDGGKAHAWFATLLGAFTAVVNFAGMCLWPVVV